MFQIYLAMYCKIIFSQILSVFLIFSVLQVGCKPSASDTNLDFVDQVIQLDKQIGDTQIELLQTKRSHYNQAVTWVLSHEETRWDSEPQGRHGTLEKQLKSLKLSQENLLDTIQKEVASLRSEKQTELILLTYAVELRNLIGPSSQQWRAFALNEWAYLKSKDDDCTSDVLKDQLLFKLSQAMLSDNPSELAALMGQTVRAVDCGTYIDALALNEALVRAYDTTLRKFPADQVENVQRVLIGSLFNLFFLVLDETKAIGKTAIFNWIQENKQALKEIIAEPVSPIGITGLWLRNPANNRLVKIRELCEHSASPSSTCISGTHLLEASVDPMRLGTGVCAFLEMLSPKFDLNVGYMCQRDVCNDNHPALKGDMTPYGVKVDELQSGRCPGGLNGDGSGWGGNGGGLVGLGGGVPGSVFSCVTEMLEANRNETPMECMAGVLNEDILNPPKEQDFIKISNFELRNECKGNPLTSGAETSTSTGTEEKDEKEKDEKEPSKESKEKLEEAKKEAQKKLDADKKKNQEKAKKAGVPISDKGYKAGKDGVKKAKILHSDKFFDKYGQSEDCGGAACTRATIDKNGDVSYDVEVSEDYFDLPGANLANTLAHEALHIGIIVTSTGSTDQSQHHDFINNVYGGGQHLCADEVNCLSSCSPRGELYEKLNKCMQKRVEEGPNGPNPQPDPLRSFDISGYTPAPIDDPLDDSWGQCNSPGNQAPKTNPACGLMLCTNPSMIGIMGDDGCACSNRIDGDVPPRNMCPYVYCAPELTAISTFEGCGCDVQGSTEIGPLPGIPTDPEIFVLEGIPFIDGVLIRRPNDVQHLRERLPIIINRDLFIDPRDIQNLEERIPN